MFQASRGTAFLSPISSYGGFPNLPVAQGPLRPDRPLTVGREATCDFVLDSRDFPGLLSRVHATLRLEDGVPVLYDSSLNGCGVDDGRTSKSSQRRAALGDGAKVTFGVRGSETEFVYTVAKRMRGDRSAASSSTGVTQVRGERDSPVTPERSIWG